MNLNQKTLDKITEINNLLLIENSDLKVIGFIDGEYKNSTSRVIVKCKEHGLGCDFGNPWNPSYYSLKSGYGCPKCSGNYRLTYKEAILKLDKNISSKLKAIGFLDGKYKNNKSKVIIECKIHGRGCNFGNPWNPSYDNLKTGNDCPKCAGKYIQTTEESINEINYFLKNKNSNLSVIGFIEGEYKNCYSKTIVECKEHGLGSNFCNPWNPSYDSLKRGYGCPKCSSTYNPTTEEAITEINKIINPNLNVIGFIESEYKNNHSKVIIECLNHGKGCNFDNSWNPSYISLKCGHGCPKCSSTYNPTTEEAISVVNKIINPNLRVIGFIDISYQGAYSRTIIECKIHGRGCNFDNPWNPSYNNLKSGYDCIKCSGQYSPTTEEAILEINKIINPNLKVISFISGKYKDKNSKTIIECKIHGKGCDFDNPWNPSYNNLKREKGCPKCSNTYNPTTEEAINEINKIINPNLRVIGFINAEYKNNKSKVIIECKKHGKGCHFGNPWNPSYYSLKSGYGCPKCAGKYIQTTEESINEINYFLKNKNSNLSVIGFIEGEYKNCHSKTIVKCKEHGLGSNFCNPWNPSYNDLKKGNGCIKCYGQYSPTTIEAINEINYFFETKNSNLKVISFVDIEYKNNLSKVIIECKEHGKGCDFDNPWNPSYDSLKREKGCPKCAIEKHNLTTCLKNTDKFNLNRNIYFITFKNLKNNEIFYKIGVSTDNGYQKRFSKSNLAKDNIQIIEAKEITTINILALLTEYYVLNNFQENKKPMYNVLKYNKGGSECFSYDLTKNLTLEEMIDNAINNFDFLINTLDLTNEEMINAKKEFLKINNI